MLRAKALQIMSLGITDDHVDALCDNGFVVVDGMFGEARAAALHAEAVAFAQSGEMPQHFWKFGSATLTKPNIFEADLCDEAMRTALPELADVLFEDALVGSLMEHGPELRLSRGPSAKSVKLQYNRGNGGCFPMHYDNAGKPSRRGVTCVVYLNPDWKEGDGGEIELRPFLRPEVVIPPLLDRAVLFRSDRILHRVRPATVPRYCFTIWLDSDAMNADADCNLTARHLSTEQTAVKHFSQSPVQRAVSRAVYAEEFEASLRCCMQGAVGCAELLEEHTVAVAKARAHPQLGPFVEHLRCVRRENGC